MERNLAEEIENSRFRLTDAAHHKEESDVWITKRHKHAGIELLYLLIKGPASIKASEQSIGASACDVIVYPAGVYHQENIDWSRNQEFYCLMLETDFILPETLRISDRGGELLWLFSSINREYHSPAKSDALLGHYIKALLLNLTKMGMEKLPVAERIEQYIRANFRERITAGEIARAAHVSESYAYRMVKKRWGISLVQLVSQVRLEEAKRLLLTSDKTIEEIAQESGFSSQKYFSRAFRKWLGCTPSQFRQGK